MTKRKRYTKVAIHLTFSLPEIGMRIPDTERDTPRVFGTPIANGCDDRWPSGRLKHAVHHLQQYEVVQVVNVIVVRQTEQVGKDAGEDHAKRKKVSEMNSFGHIAGEKHEDRVSEKVA